MGSKLYFPPSMDYVHKILLSYVREVERVSWSPIIYTIVKRQFKADEVDAQKVRKILQLNNYERNHENNNSVSKCSYVQISNIYLAYVQRKQ